MKYLFHILILGIILLISPNNLHANTPGKDFLITLDGSKLTGKVKDVSFINDNSQMTFENDYGDVYTVLPVTIFGFVFEESGETSLYESKNLDGRWMFLKVEKRGQYLSLYRSSQRQLQFTNSGESPVVVEERNPQIWLQFQGEQPFKCYKITYRGILKRRMKAYPDLSERVGKRGFRYKDLPLIVDLYNNLKSESEGD